MFTLTPREKKMAFAAALITAAWMLYGFIIRPVMARAETLNRVIPQKHTALEKLTNTSRQYTELQQQIEQFRNQLAAQPADFALLAYLEKTAETCGINNNVLSMQTEQHQTNADYFQDLVTIELENISFIQLRQFVTAAKSTPAFIRINSLNIQKSMLDPTHLDAAISISNPVIPR